MTTLETSHTLTHAAPSALEESAMMTTDDLDRFATAFTVLGRFHLRAPEDEALTSLDELLDEWPLTAEGETRLGLDLLRRSRANRETSAQIRRDLDRLYGRTATARVAPYESVHRGQDGLVFDVQTLQVRATYRALGLTAPYLNREPDDHIGLELDFLAASCLRALDALDLGDEAEAQRSIDLGVHFLRDHVLTWVPEVARLVTAKADTLFMQAVGHLTVGALTVYAELVGLTVDPAPGEDPLPA
jgi:TorA maturation chaperone TorD